jgi:cell cycle arrest protein BUB3
LVTAWDSHVYLYGFDNGQGELLKKFKHDNEGIFDVCWGKDEDEAFSAGGNFEVRK